MPTLWMRDCRLVVCPSGAPRLSEECPCDDAGHGLPCLPWPREEIECADACERLLPEVLYLQVTSSDCEANEPMPVTMLAIWSDVEGAWVFYFSNQEEDFPGSCDQLGQFYVSGVLHCGIPSFPFGSCAIDTPFTLDLVIGSCGAPATGCPPLTGCTGAVGAGELPLVELDCGPPFYLRFGSLESLKFEFSEAPP